VTGSLDPPSSKSEAAFSKQNWGDHSHSRSLHNHENVKRHSVFLKCIQSLGDLEWDDTYAKALEQNGKRSLGEEQKDSEDVEGPEESDDDEDPFDPKYDTGPDADNE
jgi:hypothetical protein